MLFEGKSLTVGEIENGIHEMRFDLQGSRVNKFDQATVAELKEGIKALQRHDNVTGVLLSSAKKSFFVGADISEFGELFKAPEAQIVEALMDINALFSELEDLPCPTVVAINGEALGGGFEICLACDYRLMGSTGKIGLPEVKLGIMPGWGGTVRLPRLIGVDNAIEWMATGSNKRASAALKDGAVDAVVSDEHLRDASLQLIRDCIEGKFDYKKRRIEKRNPLPLSTIERTMAFESARGVVGAKAGPHYPSPMTIIATIEQHASLDRDNAFKVEAAAFAKLTKSPVTASLIGIFMNDQALKKTSQSLSEGAAGVNKAAVLGAGIMGGGIAYQSASSGVPIVMKDISQQAIDDGLAEAAKQFFRQINRGRLTQEKATSAMHRIVPALSYGEFSDVDLAVEAVVENPKVKQSVLAEVEALMPEDSVLTSNTSTISIDLLATDLKRPEKFCGMHFFNPVPVMPLVEVIRGAKSSDATIATTVAYARTLGKTPIVVNDCPGFYVNRVLFPYFGGFSLLLSHGADFSRVDKLMERWGWPMGPAYLLDVVGIDTGHHGTEVMARGFPERMDYHFTNAMNLLYEAERYGQKNGVGFYRYETDKRGKPKKLVDPDVSDIIAPAVSETREFSDDEIVERMLLPMFIETVRCLEEGIVASAADADMGLVYGLGFPPFRGGALHYIDTIGMSAFVAQCDKYADLHPMYQATDGMRKMASDNQSFFGHGA